MDKKIRIRAALGISTFIIVFILALVFYRKFALRNFEYTYAIYQGTEGSAWAKSRIISFRSKKGALVKAKLMDYHDNIHVGDPIWIKYSLYDPTVVEVVDKDYQKDMKN